MNIEVDAVDPEGVAVGAEDAESARFVQGQGREVVNLHVHLKGVDLPKADKEILRLLEQGPAVAFAAVFRDQIHAVDQSIRFGEGMAVADAGHAHQIGTLKDPEDPALSPQPCGKQLTPVVSGAPAELDIGRGAEMLRALLNGPMTQPAQCIRVRRT